MTKNLDDSNIQTDDRKTLPMHRRAALSVVVVIMVVAAASVVYVSQSGAMTGQEPSFTFEEVSEETGFKYTKGGGGISTTNAGVFVIDYNRDHWPDVLATGAGGVILFENTGGEFQRANVLPEFDMTITTLLVVDYNEDGWEDLFLLPEPGTGPAAKGGKPVLVKNTGDGFTVDGRVNVTFDDFPLGATAADYNNDGHLDVFVFQAGEWSERTPVGFRNASSVGNITNDNGAPNVLLKGTATGFKDVTAKAGISGERWSLAASFMDLTGDGWPDIHVGNDFNEDILYINQHDGTFKQVRMGDFTDRDQMSSEVQDINGDGRPDIFLTNIFVGEETDLGKDVGSVYARADQAKHGGRAKGNNLLINKGGGEFVDKAAEYGVRTAPFLWGWAAVMADLDNEGDADLVHANNQKTTITSGGQQQLTSEPTYPLAWEFVDGKFVSIPASQLGFLKTDERGIAQLDFDQDGDLDIVFANNDGRYRLYENQVIKSGPGLPGLGDDKNSHSLELLVRGPDSYLAHGARVTVTTANETQYRFVTSKTDYLSQDSRILHVGVGKHTTVDTITITWDNGSTTTLTDVKTDQKLIIYPNGTITKIPLDGPAS